MVIVLFGMIDLICFRLQKVDEVRAFSLIQKLESSLQMPLFLLIYSHMVESSIADTPANGLELVSILTWLKLWHPCCLQKCSFLRHELIGDVFRIRVSFLRLLLWR